MRHFISTLTTSSFVDPVGMKPIFSLQLLSMTIVKQTGESLTLLSEDFNPSTLPLLTLDVFLKEGEFLGQGWENESKVSKANSIQNMAGMTRYKMKKAINNFIGVSGWIYGYIPHEDFVALKSIRGNLDGFYCHDLQQTSDLISAQIGEDFSVIEDSAYPIPSWQSEDGEHDRVPSTLEKALWLRDLYLFIENFKLRNNLK